MAVINQVNVNGTVYDVEALSTKGTLTLGAKTFNGSADVTAPTASTSVYGLTKLSSSTSSTSTSLAATASAVKAAYDLANDLDMGTF